MRPGASLVDGAISRALLDCFSLARMTCWIGADITKHDKDRWQVLGIRGKLWEFQDDPRWWWPGKKEKKRTSDNQTTSGGGQSIIRLLVCFYSPQQVIDPRTVAIQLPSLRYKSSSVLAVIYFLVLFAAFLTNSLGIQREHCRFEQKDQLRAHPANRNEEDAPSRNENENIRFTDPV